MDICTKKGCRESFLSQQKRFDKTKDNTIKAHSSLAKEFMKLKIPSFLVFTFPLSDFPFIIAAKSAAKKLIIVETMKRPIQIQS